MKSKHILIWEDKTVTYKDVNGNIKTLSENKLKKDINRIVKNIISE